MSAMSVAKSVHKGSPRTIDAEVVLQHPRGALSCFYQHYVTVVSASGGGRRGRRGAGHARVKTQESRTTKTQGQTQEQARRGPAHLDTHANRRCITPSCAYRLTPFSGTLVPRPTNTDGWLGTSGTNSGTEMTPYSNPGLSSPAGSPTSEHATDNTTVGGCHKAITLHGRASTTAAAAAAPP
jgi:hypothetical protein